MKNFEGAVTAPDEVIAGKYLQFYETIAAETSAESYVYLAALIRRLTPAMMTTLQNSIQKKLAFAERVEPKLGVVAFAWNVLRKHPKMFNHNQNSILTICKNALDYGFKMVYVEETAYNPEVVFCLFSTYFQSSMEKIIDTADALRGYPPHKDNKILLLPVMNEYGREMHSHLLCYFLDLVKAMIIRSDEGSKIPMEKIVQLVTGCLDDEDELVHSHALDLITHVAKSCKDYYLIVSNVVFSVIKNFDISPNVLFKFLLELNAEIGCLVDIHRFFPHLITNFADGLKISGEVEAATGLMLVDRPECSEIVNQINKATKKEIPDYNLYAELIATIIEKNPSSLPIEPLIKIQQCVCHRILGATKPLAVDLRILNALLAVSNEQMPSPCQVARTVYSWTAVCRDKELAPYANIGRALCEAQRSSRFISYPQQEPKLNDANFNIITLNDLPMDAEINTFATKETIIATTTSEDVTDTTIVTVESRTTTIELHEEMPETPEVVEPAVVFQEKPKETRVTPEKVKYTRPQKAKRTPSARVTMAEVGDDDDDIQVIKFLPAKRASEVTAENVPAKKSNVGFDIGRMLEDFQG